MFTACLLHFNLDLLSAIRYVGNIHTGSHRDWNLLESTLKRADADKLLISSLRRVYLDGCPNYVNATSSEANRCAYAEYGNHPTVKQHWELTKKALTKDVMRNYVLPVNPLLSAFFPDTQLIPQGLVLADRKPPRQVCDSSHHPLLTSMAVNDWTTKDTEPPLIFAGAFTRFLTWIWNLCITYPDLEIYVGDDDVLGAFRHAQNNPNVVRMNAFMLLGFLLFATGQTFGGKTCPSNWEVIAIACMVLARFFLWNLADTVSRALQYLPWIITAEAPTPDEVLHFTKAEADSQNPGVLNSDGSRQPPTFDHHVDGDCLYADVGPFLLTTISASVLALYTVLGFPDASCGIRDCVSWEKFESTFLHRRKTLGWLIDSCHMTVALPPAKPDNILAVLTLVFHHPALTIREIAQILGLLGNATVVKRDMKCSFFNLERAL